MVVALASIADHNAQPERDSLLRANVPVLEGPTRVATAFGGLVTLLLNIVPVLFSLTRAEK